MKYNFGFFFGVWTFAWGLSCICFPQWWYKKVSPEQMARDRRRFKILGYILTPLGAAALVLHLLSRCAMSPNHSIQRMRASHLCQQQFGRFWRLARTADAAR